MVTDKDGWKTYPGKVDGANIAITLREAQDNKKDLATSGAAAAIPMWWCAS